MMIDSNAAPASRVIAQFIPELFWDLFRDTQAFPKQNSQERNVIQGLSSGGA
jgi:hypothetical protein